MILKMCDIERDTGKEDVDGKWCRQRHAYAQVAHIELKSGRCTLDFCRSDNVSTILLILRDSYKDSVVYGIKAA